MREFRHQSINEILDSSTPEQRIMWEAVMLITGENCAVRRLHYQGVGAGEFGVYFNTKLYLALELGCTFTSGTAETVNYGSCDLYDMANNQFYSLGESSFAYNTVANAMRYSHADIERHNLIFSRITFNSYTRFKFIGYRIIF